MYCTCYALKDDEAIERDWTGFEEGRPFRVFSLKPGLGLSDECVNWWLDYCYNDGDYRYGLRFSKGLQREIHSSIPVAIKRKFKIFNEDFYEDYKKANQANVEESLCKLADNAERYGASRDYTAGQDFYKNLDAIERFDESPDNEIKAFRRACKEMARRQNPELYNPLK